MQHIYFTVYSYYNKGYVRRYLYCVVINKTYFIFRQVMSMKHYFDITCNFEYKNCLVTFQIFKPNQSAGWCCWNFTSIVAGDAPHQSRPTNKSWHHTARGAVSLVINVSSFHRRHRYDHSIYFYITNSTSSSQSLPLHHKPVFLAAVAKVYLPQKVISVSWWTQRTSESGTWPNVSCRWWAIEWSRNIIFVLGI